VTTTTPTRGNGQRFSKSATLFFIILHHLYHLQHKRLLQNQAGTTANQPYLSVSSQVFLNFSTPVREREKKNKIIVNFHHHDSSDTGGPVWHLFDLVGRTGLLLHHCRSTYVKNGSVFDPDLTDPVLAAAPNYTRTRIVPSRRIFVGSRIGIILLYHCVRWMVHRVGLRVPVDWSSRIFITPSPVHWFIGVGGRRIVVADGSHGSTRSHYRPNIGNIRSLPVR
jgi:hypothetical protein